MIRAIVCVGLALPVSALACGMPSTHSLARSFAEIDEPVVVSVQEALSDVDLSLVRRLNGAKAAAKKANVKSATLLENTVGSTDGVAAVDASQ